MSPRKTKSHCEVEIGGVIGSQIMLPCERLQRYVRPDILRLDSDREQLEILQILRDLYFGNSLALGERYKDAVGDFERPHLWHNRNGLLQLVEHGAAVGRVFG